MLYIFDIDGTITEDYKSTLLPDAEKWFARNQPTAVALATNQGGAGLRRWMETAGFGNPENYPTEMEVRERVAATAGAIKRLTGNEVATYISFLYFSQKGNWQPIPDGEQDNQEWSMAWRKPNPGMLLQAAADAGLRPMKCVFVGDTETDMQAAEAAGMNYTQRDVFFFLRR